MEEDEESSILWPDYCSSIDCSELASEDLGVESMADDQSVDFEFNFEEACQSGTIDTTDSTGAEREKVCHQGGTGMNKCEQGMCTALTVAAGYRGGGVTGETADRRCGGVPAEDTACSGTFADDEGANHFTADCADVVAHDATCALTFAWFEEVATLFLALLLLSFFQS
mgnify:CR=1 FL=1